MRPATVPAVLGLPLVLQPLDASHAEAWFEYASNLEVMRYTSSSVRTLDDLMAIVGRISAPEPGTPIHFAVLDRSDGRLVGTAGFHTISVLNRTAEITYDVHPGRQGQGIATAVCAALTAWGFEDQGFTRIQATVQLPNEVSARVLARCGYELEGRVRNFRLVRGEPCDYLMWSRLPGTAPARPGLQGIHHAAIICSDYERSRRFYTECLGLRVLAEHYREARRSYKLDLLLPDGAQVELFSFPDAPPRPSYPEAQGLRHLAFKVDDVAAWKARLESAGVPVEPLRTDEYTGRRFTFFADPDGLPLELYEGR